MRRLKKNQQLYPMEWTFSISRGFFDMTFQLASFCFKKHLIIGIQNSIEAREGTVIPVLNHKLFLSKESNRKREVEVAIPLFSSFFTLPKSTQFYVENKVKTLKSTLLHMFVHLTKSAFIIYKWLSKLDKTNDFAFSNTVHK